MIIKQLHIRNIASIESADIDFQNGIVDSSTGEPVPMFLISGDTGAGKSVILDAISLALFKNSPRLEAVSAKTRNEFRNSDGVKVNVFSPEQYTRIGITDKDPCYCELVFEGINGLEYTAKYTLGMKKTKDASGRTVFATKTPTWSLTQGSMTLTKEEDIIPERDKAIGISYDQFCRMSMLAQGKFETFLCGSKKERADVLEELTNTEMFGRYGDAIKSLASKAKATHKEKENAYNLIKEKTLGEPLVAELKSRLASLETGISSHAAKIKAEEETITTLSKIVTDKASLENAEKEIAECERIQKSEDYLSKKDTVKRYMESEEQRNAYSTLQEDKRKLQILSEKELKSKETYNTLYADYLFRKGTISGCESDIETKQAVVDSKKDLDKLFTEHKVVVTKLGAFDENRTRLSTLDAAAKESEGKITTHKENLSEAKKAWDESKKALDAKQAEIDGLSEKRDALQVDELNSSLKTLNEAKSSLGRLSTEIIQYDKDTEAGEKLYKEINLDLKTLDEVLSSVGSAKDAMDSAKKQSDAATFRYNTLDYSLNETIIKLRNDLVESESKECPLCGAAIDKTLSKLDLTSSLSILKQEMDKSAAELESATEKYRAENNRYVSLSSAIEVKKKDLAGKKKAHDEAFDSLSKLADTLGIPVDGHIQDSIERREKDITNRISEIEALQKVAEDIQKTINGLDVQKKALASDEKKKQEACHAIETALSAEITRLGGLKDEKSQRTETGEQLKGDLEKEVDIYRTDWADDIPAFIDELTKEASTYLGNKQNLENAKALLSALKDVVATIEDYIRNIKGLYPDWTDPTHPIESKPSSILIDWTGFIQSAAQVYSNRNQLEKSISEKGEILQAYYESTGTNAADLEQLIAKSGVIAQYRKDIGDVDTNLASQNAIKASAQESIGRSLSSLGVKSIEECPSMEERQNIKSALTTERDGLLQEKASIEEKLSADSKMEESVKKQKDELDKAEKERDFWKKLDNRFGGVKFRTLVQAYILRPLLDNANVYLRQITDRYTLSCSDENEQLSILVLDNYNKKEVRSATLLSGGEKFMISLALSLALSTLNKAERNTNILFIDEGFGTLDRITLDSVMRTLESLQHIAGQTGKRVGIISHRDELDERIPHQIRVEKKGEGRSQVTILG